MKSLTIDLTGIQEKDALHDCIAAGLELTDEYGRNLDALHDVLTSLPVPCQITVIGYNVPQDTSEASYFQTLKKVCDDAEEELTGLTFLWESGTGSVMQAEPATSSESETSAQEPPKVRPQKMTNPDVIDPSNSPFYKKCFVCGPDNADGLHLQNRYIDGKAHMEFTPTERMIGLVTRKGSLMHGGFTSMIFDEVMTYVMMGRGIETVTLNMSIDYVSPARTGHHMVAEAWIERTEGRKLWAEAEIVDEETGETVAKAKGLYYKVDLTAFINGIDG